MRVLLTGSSGQVGGALKARLAAFDVLAPDRKSFDLERNNTIASCIEAFRPNVIVNCAAYTAVDDAERDRDRAMQVNAIAPGVMADSARKVGAALLHFSTDYVFDGKAREPYLESSICAPVNFYGETKLLGEQAIAASGIPALTIRTSWVYGPSGRNFLRTMLQLGADKHSIDVVNDQTGSPTSALFLADSIASILQAAVKAPSEYFRANCGILNMTCAGETTWHGFANEIFAEANRRGMELAVRNVRPVSTSNYPRPANRPAYSVLKLSRLQNFFGIVPVSWRDALGSVMDQLGVLNSTIGKPEK